VAHLAQKENLPSIEEREKEERGSTKCHFSWREYKGFQSQEYEYGFGERHNTPILAKSSARFTAD